MIKRLKRLAAIAAVVSFTLCMPSMVTASSDLDFSDTRDHWAQAYIAKAVEQNLMQGIGKNEQGEMLFAPNEVVTRAQAAAVLVRAFGFNDDERQSIPDPAVSDFFQDVEEQSWYARSVLLCAVNEVFPFKGEFFYPDRPITRLEMAQAIQNSFTARKIAVPMIELMPYFNDTPDLSNREMNAVVFVHNTGIMKGNDGYFRPHDCLTRGELARIITACKDLIDLNTQTDIPASPTSPESDLQEGQDIKEANPQQGSLIDYKHYIQQQDHMDVDLEVPVLVGMTNSSLQQEINARWEKAAEEFQQEVASTLEEYVYNAQTNGYPVHRYQAVSRVQEGFCSDRFLSIYIDYYSYTGGAHGFTERRAYNIDLTTGQELGLSDLFAPEYDYISIINEAVSKQIQANPDVFFDGEMGFKGIDRNQPYYIKDGNLVIYFGLYEIAPYAAGIQEFKIPLAQFGDNLAGF